MKKESSFLGIVRTVMKMEMKNVQSGHSTQIVVSSPQYDIKVDKSMFTVAKLEKGL